MLKHILITKKTVKDIILNENPNYNSFSKESKMYVIRDFVKEEEVKPMYEYIEITMNN